MTIGRKIQVWKAILLWCPVGLMLVACGSSDGSAAVDTGQLTLAGSTSVEPFAELLAEHYMATTAGAPVINVQGGGSSAGVRAALSGAAGIGMSSRNLKPEEIEQGLATQLIARDAIAVIVHPENGVRDLSLADVRGIFSGSVANWSLLGGEDRPIVVVTREEGSGTRGAFEELVMDGQFIVSSALRQDSNGAVRVIVGDARYSIGYISLGLVNDRVRAVRLDGIEATVQTARDGSYGLSRPFLFLWTGELAPEASRFIDYVLSEEGQALLAREGLVTGQE